MSGRAHAVEGWPLVVEVDVTDGTATVSVDGEVDMATVADPGDGLAKGLAVEGPKVGAVPHLWRCLVRGATLGEGPADQHRQEHDHRERPVGPRPGRSGSRC